MNKKLLSLLFIPSFLTTSCGFFSSNDEGKGGEEEKEDVTFEISDASFINNEGRLLIHYICNLGNPFLLEDYTFSRLNNFGVATSNIDYSTENSILLTTSIIQTSLKLEFYDNNNVNYITARFNNVTLYEEEKDPIDYPSGYNTLYWRDEFDGDSLDTNKWTYEIGNGSWGWGNGEAQYYTDHNDTVKDGYLTISAKKEIVDNFEYTSTRIKTQNKVHFTYGYVEARIALPAISGMWPAFWMMPNDSIYGGWPHSGEIDIMEARGRIANQSSSAIHFSTLSGDHTYLTDEKNGHNISEFHKYAVEWQQDYIRFYVDGVLYFSTSKEQWTTAGAKSSVTAPFDKDFYIILNLAVGGQFDNWSMPPASFTSADMKIDYVRVFK